MTARVSWVDPSSWMLSAVGLSLAGSPEDSAAGWVAEAIPKPCSHALWALASEMDFEVGTEDSTVAEPVAAAAEVVAEASGAILAAHATGTASDPRAGHHLAQDSIAVTVIAASPDPATTREDLDALTTGTAATATVADLAIATVVAAPAATWSPSAVATVGIVTATVIETVIVTGIGRGPETEAGIAETTTGRETTITESGVMMEEGTMIPGRCLATNFARGTITGGRPPWWSHLLASRGRARLIGLVTSVQIRETQAWQAQLHLALDAPTNLDDEATFIARLRRTRGKSSKGIAQDG